MTTEPPKPHATNAPTDWTLPNSVHGWAALTASAVIAAVVGGFVYVYIHRILDAAKD